MSRKSMKCPFCMKCKYVPQCVLILYVRLYHINQQIKCLLYKHLSLFVGPHRKLESMFWKQNFGNKIKKNGLKMPQKVPHGNFQCACKVCKYLLWDYHLVMSQKYPYVSPFLIYLSKQNWWFQKKADPPPKNDRF